jgi:hypothetical protein
MFSRFPSTKGFDLNRKENTKDSVFKDLYSPQVDNSCQQSAQYLPLSFFKQYWLGIVFGQLPVLDCNHDH